MSSAEQPKFAAATTNVRDVMKGAANLSMNSLLVGSAPLGAMSYSADALGVRK